MDDDEARAYLEELTIVIFSRNRPIDLRRTMDYWSRWPVTLLVLDGSDLPLDVLGTRYGAAAVEAFSAVSMNARFEYAAANIHSSFACLHTDDDYLLARSVASALRALTTRPQLSCIASDGQFFDGAGQFSPSISGREILFDYPRDRLMDHFSHWSWSYVYGLHRAATFSQALSAVADAMNQAAFTLHSNLIGFEFGMEICGSVLGRLGSTPDVLLLKRVGNENQSYHESQTWAEWLLDPAAEEAVLSWRRTLSQHLSPYAGVSPETMNSWIQDALSKVLTDCQSASSGRRGSLQTLATFPLPRDSVGRVSHALRPKSHPSEDGYLGRSRRLARRTHRAGFIAARRLFRAGGGLVGRGRPGSARAPWSWGDRRDLADYWESERSGRPS